MAYQYVRGEARQITFILPAGSKEWECSSECSNIPTFLMICEIVSLLDLDGYMDWMQKDYKGYGEELEAAT